MTPSGEVAAHLPSPLMIPASGRYHARLLSWQRSMDLVVVCYALARRLPDFEGYGRAHRGDYVRHLSIARGSITELQTLLDLCERLDYVLHSELRPARDLADRVASLLSRQI